MSLPPFAQAFSMDSLTLPPIDVVGKKRTRTSVARDDDDDPSDSDSDIRVKQELDDDEPSPPPSFMPSSKKRRVTVSGPQPQPLRIDVRPNPEQPASTPISPVVMGFKVQRDNPNAMEQVRSMITVKQKQKALIEQRRGSVAGLMSPVANTPPTPVEERNNISSKIPPPPAPSSNNRTSRRSPNTATGVRRLNNNSQSQRVPSPQPSQQQTPPTHSLPPPPISFARRRAAQLGAKKKPADIVISPREAHTQDQFQPSIQSAPPIPQAAGQSQFYPTRFTMALPRLPPTVIGSGDNVRRITANVPPTPTRLSLQHNSSTASSVAPAPLRSPTAPSVPIASTLVPPTPTAFHRLGYSGEKSAFLAPFEVFYDALNDSKQLKTWLGEQLQKSHSLMQSLSQQQDRINDTVDNLVEKRMAGMKSEMAALRRRVEELEDSLRTNNNNSTNKSQNGQSCGVPVAPESYSFPSIPAANSHDTPSRLRAENSGPSRRLSSPGWGQERDRPLPQQQQHQHAAESDNLNGGSSAPYEAKRLSATRLDPPRVQHSNGSNMQSSSQGYREHSNNNHNNHNNQNGNSGSGKQIVYPPTPTSGHLHHPSSRNGGEGPSSSRQNSSLPIVMISGESQRDHDSGSGRRSRVGSRRNSIVMSGPDGES